MLGFHSIGPKTSDVIDAYTEVVEKKDDKIAVVIANHTNRKERASAAAIGAGFGVVQGGLFAGGYALAKAFPFLQKNFIGRWVVSKVDEWIDVAKTAHPERSAFRNISSGVLMKTLYLVGSGAVLGYLFSLGKTYLNTRINGKISSTKQGALDDSALLSGLNSLSSTKDGQNIIKNSIQKNNDNTITVKFRGIDKEYKITNEELKQASKSYLSEVDEQTGKVKTFKRKYAKGDGDVIAFELAFEKYQNDIKSGEISFPENIPDYVKEVGNFKGNSLNNISVEQLYYLLSGKEAVKIDTNNENAGDYKGLLDLYAMASLNKFIKTSSSSKDRCSATVKFNKTGDSDDIVVKNIYKQKVKLDANSYYSIKGMTPKSVTLVDSKKSKEKIDIPLEVFKQNLCSLSYLDNSNK